MANNQALAFDATLQNNATGAGNGTVFNVGGLTFVTLQVTGVFVGTINPEGTIDDTNWISLFAINMTNGLLTNTITATGLYLIPVAGCDQFRARIGPYTSGLPTVTAKGSNAGSPFNIVTSGAGSTALPQNLMQVGSSAIALGQAAMGSSIPVAIASNQSPVPVTIPAGLTIAAGQVIGLTGQPLASTGDGQAASTIPETGIMLRAGATLDQLREAEPFTGAAQVGDLEGRRQREAIIILLARLQLCLDEIANKSSTDEIPDYESAIAIAFG